MIDEQYKNIEELLEIVSRSIWLTKMGLYETHNLVNTSEMGYLKLRDE